MSYSNYTFGKGKPGLTGFIRKTGTYVKDFFTRVIKFLTPDPSGMISGGYGIIGIILVMLIITAILHVRIISIPVLGLFILYFLLQGFMAALGVYIVVMIYNGLNGFYRWVFIGAVAISLSFWNGTIQGKLVIAAVTVFSASLFAGTLWMINKEWKNSVISNKVVNISGLVLGLAGLFFGGYWLIMEGVKTDTPENASLKSEYRPAHINLPDPSSEGDYTVLELFYGSGRDKHRKEFGEDVNIKTDSVDGSRFVSNWKKFHGWARTKYWGFDEKSLPLNARVWYPGGEGPFPLVLIVHGNHADRDYSDPGYEYLGRLMASRGFIFASVDENFLNNAWSNIFKSLEEENDCRGWLLLKHLELWHQWNANTKNPFYGKVDLENIALIGHSRGGEAVAIAACFNQLPYYPDDATVPFDFGFNIRSVIAIAPVDGQYKPAKTSTFFENVNYFVLQGSQDMDMKSYHGSRQFQRIKFTDGDYYFKAGVYILGANHGQFNTVWGKNDVGYPGIALYNKKQVIHKNDQEKIGKVYISAFLEATLHDQTGYIPIFRDYRTALDWLPGTIYLNQFEDTECDFICTYEEDIDLSTTTLEGGCIMMENLTVWKERMVPLKWGQHDTRAVYVGWNREETDSLVALYTVTQPEDRFIQTDSSNYLYFVMADANEDSNPHQGEEESKNTDNHQPETDQNMVNEKDNHEKNKKNSSAEDDKKDDEEKKEPVDLRIALTDSSGNKASVALSQYAFLQPQIEVKYMKADFMTDVAKSEIVFQVFFIPLREFGNENPHLDIRHVKKIDFIFDQTEKGVVVLDNIGFWKLRAD